MLWTGAAICIVLSGLLIALSLKRKRGLQELALHSIAPDDLYALISSNRCCCLMCVSRWICWLIRR